MVLKRVFCLLGYENTRERRQFLSFCSPLLGSGLHIGIITAEAGHTSSSEHLVAQSGVSEGNLRDRVRTTINHMVTAGSAYIK